MPQTEEPSRPRNQFNLSWPTALSLFTAIVAALTVTLHLIGDVRHRQYLKYWDINAGMFPKTTDWILINGFYGVVDRFVAILVAMFSNVHWLAIAACILGTYAFILSWPTSGKPGETPAWLLRQPEWRRRLIRQMLLSALFVSMIPCALLLLTAFMAVLAAFGEIAGRSAAEKEALEYRKGCELSRIACVELSREGGMVATGFVLDVSPSHIAIFDTQTQRGRVLNLDKLEMASKRVPKLKDGAVP